MSDWIDQKLNEFVFSPLYLCRSIRMPSRCFCFDLPSKLFHGIKGRNGMINECNVRTIGYTPGSSSQHKRKVHNKRTLCRCRWSTCTEPFDDNAQQWILILSQIIERIGDRTKTWSEANWYPQRTTNRRSYNWFPQCTYTTIDISTNPLHNWLLLWSKSVRCSLINSPMIACRTSGEFDAMITGTVRAL